MDSSKFNAGTYKYDWIAKNNDECNNNNRRIWFAVRNDSPIQFKPIPVLKPKENVHSASFNREEFIIPQVTYSHSINTNGDRRFVIVIPSYNNSAWCEKNVLSALNQDYDNFRIIFTDDCSSDGTFDKVTKIVNLSGKADKCKLIRNNVRIGALENLYNMIHSCDDDEIILTLDGDDWFPNNQVLNKLKKHYSDEIWMTYGQYQNSGDGGTGVAQEYPKHIINANGFRNYAWGASHLRTFYSWLFKNIRKEDLLYNNQFMKMTWDLATMLPMLEMAGHHSKFISEILYIYNTENPINDHKVDRSLQAMLDKYVRARGKYQKLESTPIKKNIGLLLIATNKYTQFIQGLITSADKFFLTNEYNVTYYIFSDKDNIITTNRNVVNIKIEHKQFPYASMDRFKHFIQNADKMEKEQYLFYCDVDSLFVSNIGSEIIGSLVGVQHCRLLWTKRSSI